MTRDYVAELRAMRDPDLEPERPLTDWRAHPYQAHPRWYEWAAVVVAMLAYLGLIGLVLVMVAMLTLGTGAT